MALKWDEKYEVGHARIDAEHQIFLGLIIDFKSAIDNDAPREKLLRILKEVEKYAEFHFVSEENIMIDVGYPEKEKHTVIHNHLLAELHDQNQQFKAKVSSAESIFEFLFEWFALHTSNEDKKLAHYITQ